MKENSPPRRQRLSEFRSLLTGCGICFAAQEERVFASKNRFSEIKRALAARSQVVVGFVSFILLLASALHAATYYVATNGSDANPGSQTDPWLTIQHSTVIVEAGDTVLVQPGFYNEVVRINNNSGTAASPIIFRANGSVKVGGFYVLKDGITLDGFEVSGDTVTKWDGAIRVNSSANYLRVFDCYIHDLTNSAGVMFVPGGPSPAQSSANCIVSNNIFDTIGYPNVIIYGSNNLVTANVFRNSFGEGDATRVWGCNNTISANVITNQGGGPTGITGGHPDCIQTFGDGGYAAYNVVFERNFIINSSCQLCQLEQKGVIDIRDWTFRNNVFINVIGAANCDLPGVWWYNNVFYHCTTNTAHVIGFSDGSTGKGAATRSGAINNVFLECGIDPSNTGKGWYDAPATLTDLDCDYNYVAGQGFAPKKSSSVRSEFVFSEAHGINGGDPKFTSLMPPDFRPQTVSRLVGAGRNLSEFFTNDIAGRQRPSVDAWNIGAYHDVTTTQAVVQPPTSLRVLNPLNQP